MPRSPVAALAAAALAATATATRVDVDLCRGAAMRPVLMVPGFLGVPLYDSARNYDPEWPDLDAFGQPVGPGATDLDLPMEWRGLEQARSAVGPERGPEDAMPDMDDTLGRIFTSAVYSQLRRLVSSWQHPTRPELPLFYTVAYDFRRDFYEQAERVMLKLEHIYEATQCKPLLIGHSFGGVLAYLTIARYLERASGVTAGVLYATAPLQGASTQVAALSVNSDVATSLARPPVDTLFTFPSVYMLGPSARTACANTDALFSNATRLCGDAQFATGVSCNSTACGRPSHWPSDEPFLLPLDLQDPHVWAQLGLASPMLDSPSAKQRKHLEAALACARRAGDLVSGPGAAAVQAIHPPAAVVSMALDAPAAAASMPHYITCVPTAAFGDAAARGEKWCSEWRLGGEMAGDGTLLGYAQELHGAGWDRSVLTYRMTKRPPGWPPLLRNEHSASLLLAHNSFEPLDCRRVEMVHPGCVPEGEYPSLERLLCTLVHRADKPDVPFSAAGCPTRYGLEAEAPKGGGRKEWGWYRALRTLVSSFV